jgi:AcrR family transcriptional regulator
MTPRQEDCKKENVTDTIVETGTLKDRQLALTRQLILDAAVEQLESGAFHDLTMRSVAKRANLAERTLFRHFATREELLDALAAEVSARLELPALPGSAIELPAVPRALYRAFEARANLTKAALHSELFDRIRETTASARWKTVRALIDEFAPQASERDRMLAAANIRYLLAATSWHYYRFYFRFTLKDSIAAAEVAIQRMVEGLE